MNKSSIAWIATALTVCVCGSIYAADTKVSDVTKDKIGQTVSLQGTASSFRASKGEKSPSSFMLKDSSGETRVVIWPDVYGKITGKVALEKDGAQVKVDGEVAEYRDKIEVHVKDAASVKVTDGSTSSSSASTAAKSTSSTK